VKFTIMVQKTRFMPIGSVLLMATILAAIGSAADGPRNPQQSGQAPGDGGADTLLEVDLLQHEGGITDFLAAEQRGGRQGHLPPSNLNVELVGQLTVSDIVPGRISDVGALGNFAYLGAFAEPCGSGGVYVVDISDPSNPREVGFIATGPGSFVGEGVQARRLDTKDFKGDVLVINNEVCKATGNQIGGLSIFDVIDP
jgi:hypothetical protein